ncbi:HEAT repeat domain-containing protein [Salinirubrum litoreum]|uniref:HEAT repeat domain-containing protein n=1 Tax=Salinirubrum litoreum TaxID=1126234 RepID=A0ABD5RF14_9EURY|nr:HEAT repeat domain-containing protein [Salinirubrum litoreum]
MSDWAVAWHDPAGIDTTVYRNVAVFLADRGDHPDDHLTDALADGLPCSLSFSFARVGTVRFRLDAAGDDWLRLVPTAGTDDPESALALLGRCIELFERFDFDRGLVAPEAALTDLDTSLPDSADGSDLGDLTRPEETSAVFLDGETTDDIGAARLAATPAVAALELLDGSALLLGGPDLADARLRLDATRSAPTSEDLPLRDAMSWALGWLDTPAVADRLAGVLAAGTADTEAGTDAAVTRRVAATETLGLLRRTDTGSSLRRALADPAPAVRAAAAEALTPSDADSRTALLDTARDDAAPDVRRRAVRSLADGPRADATVEALAEVASRDAEPAVRAAAVRAIGDARGPAFHADRLADERPVRVAAAETLQLFADGTADADTDLAAVADRLVPALSDDTPAVRRAVADLLGSVTTPAATTALCRATTTDPDAEVRATAVTALGQQFAGRQQGRETATDDRRDDAVEALLTALTDESAVRERVPDALGRLGDERATEPLIDALSGDSRREDAADDVPVRRAAANALGNLGDQQAVEPLLDALDDPDDLVREQAAVSLGQLDDERAVGPVVDLLDAAENDRLRYRLVSALSGFSGQQATDALARLAETDDSEDVRTAAEWALTRRE